MASVELSSREETMFKKVILQAALASLAMVGASLAQTVEGPNEVPMQSVIEQPRDQIDARPTSAFLSEISNWLAANFDLPTIHELPRIGFAKPLQLVSMRYKGMLPEAWREDSINDPAVQAAVHREVVAVYNDTTRTIFLPNSWTGKTVAEQSVLVHEMVHHLRNLAKLKYDCPAAREKLAYQAQDQWLKRFGQDLEKEFEIDTLTLLVTSACMN
jgi:hypothetical protein